MTRRRHTAPAMRPARDAAPCQAIAPELRGFADDVLAGLSGSPKRLSSKYFYDDRGSRLFERIMRLPSSSISIGEPPVSSARRRQVALFLGSNLGNFTDAEAARFLRRVRVHLRVGDSLLLGLDLRKDPHTVLAAYDDPEGVTAAFNLNLLRRLNRELGMDFDLDRFRHYASYCPLQGVARSFLVSQARQTVRSRVLDHAFEFGAGEFIYTEQSQKYERAGVDALAEGSGFEVKAWFEDAALPYALVVCRAAAG
jgi:uncharacterized SAM-dependent methyltransferase